ncbi:MAG: hypothetical protein GQ574_04990 [Crocinitomix sp.]|nr:hypothetical protein [Crocinitomix sp.]
MINFFIDLIISTALSLVIMKTVILPIQSTGYYFLDIVVPVAVFTGIRLAYYFIFEAFLGGTIGQRLTKSRIVTLDKGHPSLFQYILRSLSRPITGAGSFISDDIQSFHDKNSKTYVITKEN